MNQLCIRVRVLVFAGFLSSLLPVVGMAKGEPPPQGSPATDAKALEIDGLRDITSVLITSDPVGARVLVDDVDTCNTPCRLSLSPGMHKVTFRHPKREEVSVERLVTSSEQIQIHGVLGKRTSWKVILPTYFVGAIFTGAGLSSILMHGKADLGSTDLPTDERRFHRNLGIASVAIGLPLLGMATYLALSGKPGEVRTSASSGRDFRLAPLVDKGGSLLGASLIVWWR
ncbi:MAG: PEGA domain-containing protein [Deltaproteobacteria bacterium]|nr:PEGA domain-containing protein [Deltaproteobacteria bacterium]